MRVIFAIAKQTVRASLRSRVFHLLLFLTILSVILLPLTVSGDGTATGELQVSLTYSLKAVVGLLSLAALWLGCAGIAREIESYQIHLVMTKPAAGWQVWCGKWLGIWAMTCLIAALALATIHGLISLKMAYRKFDPPDLSRAREEVLVGRRVFTPQQIDFAAIARQEYERLKAEGRLHADHDPGQVMAELVRQIKAKSTEVGSQQARFWRFQGVRTAGAEARVYVRYRLYVASTSQSQQRVTEGVWGVINPTAERQEEHVAILPQRVMGGTFHEFAFPAAMVGADKTVILQYNNYDQQNVSIIFQTDDGPTLMVRVTSFTSNLVRAGLVVMVRLALLTALGCTLGGALSTPVALFAAFAYLLLGLLADPTIGAPVKDTAGNVLAWKPGDVVAHAVAVAIDRLVVSFDDYDVSFRLARGRLIELALLLKLVVRDLILKGGPLTALGLLVITRRELGKVIRR